MRLFPTDRVALLNALESNCNLSYINATFGASIQIRVSEMPLQLKCGPCHGPHSLGRPLRVLSATRIVRKMRGCCQPFLIDTNDGPYVVKFKENPIGHRTLVNELISSTLLHALGVSTPATALVYITEDFLAENTVSFSIGSKEAYPGAGLHFGSRHPGQEVSVYDVLPGALLNSIRNRDDFFGAAVFDSWISNSDFRQAVFFRTARGDGFQAAMIDHSEAFDGPLWSFTDVAIARLSRMRELYDSMTAEALEPWLARVAHLPTQVIVNAAEAVPEEWLQGSREALNRLLEALIRRQRRIDEIVDLWFQGWLSRNTQGPVRYTPEPSLPLALL